MSVGGLMYGSLHAVAYEFCFVTFFLCPPVLMSALLLAAGCGFLFLLLSLHVCF